MYSSVSVSALLDNLKSKERKKWESRENKWDDTIHQRGATE